MKRLLILSGKGGTGKTTTAAAFAAFSGAKAVADCDVDAPNLHLVTKQTAAPVVTDFLGGDKAWIDPAKCVRCGMCQDSCRFHAIKPTGSSYAVDEYACEGCGVCAYVCPENAVTLEKDVAGAKRLFLGDGVFSTATLKMGRGNSGKLVAEVKMAMLKHAAGTELAIVDGSPGIGCPVIASISGMDLVLIVAEPSLSGISDLDRLIQTTSGLSCKVAVCVNKWDISPDCTEEIRRFCHNRQIPFVGVIPYDKSASEAINAGRSIAEADCPARDALREIYTKTMKLLFV